MHQPHILPEAQPERNEDERRRWLEKLRLHLQDPEFRRIAGFPKASDEAILALSDPPYYTACPNPFMDGVISRWQQERSELRKQLALDGDETAYHRQPFAADVSEGKNDPIYNAHSYHTKVPHKAIMRYILHYTDPGDIVLDGFCGTGMTGVAAQLCGDKRAVQELGYRVDEQGVIREGNEAVSRLGARKAVLIDLSPAATFIAYNYNTPVDTRAFEREARRILQEAERECGWMYETWHPHCDATNRVKGKINYTVWSDVFLCPECGGEMTFWDVAVDHENGKVSKEWNCPHCRARLSKNPPKGGDVKRVERAFETKFDRALGKSVRQAKQVPVLINYTVSGGGGTADSHPRAAGYPHGQTKSKRYEKRPDAFDLALLQKIEDNDIPYPFPTDTLPDGFNTQQPRESHGLTHVHHFYTRRNLWALAGMWNNAPKSYSALWKDVFQSLVVTLTSKLTRFNMRNRGNGPVSGTLYIASMIAEENPFIKFARKLKDFLQIVNHKTQISYEGSVLSTNSSSTIFLSENSLNYIFVDPPFGANLMYSELNFLWEAWLGVFTNNEPEAVINKTQRKGLAEYQALMEACFGEFYRVLKPGRWMTVEFHNSQNAVWNAIQEALLRAGFMVADVRTLDKKQGTFKQVTTTSAVKQDLIISAYKPAAEFERRFLAQGGSADAAWDFIRQHLEQLPMPALKDGVVEFIEERAPYLLYDRMVAFHVQRGLAVPLSAAEFYAGLRERFAERDGMFFTFLQSAEYDRRRLQAERVEQLALFVSDEKSAVQWLRRELQREPQTYQELHPRFIRELHQAAYEAMPELKTILEENFLQDERGRWYLPDPGRESDLQALREKSLLREFGLYLKGRGKLKSFRLEAVRAGFSRAWKDRQYETILEVAARLPERALEDDPQLLMYVDNARLRAAAQPKQERLI